MDASEPQVHQKRLSGGETFYWHSCSWLDRQSEALIFFKEDTSCFLPHQSHVEWNSAGQPVRPKRRGEPMIRSGPCNERSRCTGLHT